MGATPQPHQSPQTGPNGRWAAAVQRDPQAGQGSGPEQVGFCRSVAIFSTVILPDLDQPELCGEAGGGRRGWPWIAGGRADGAGIVAGRGGGRRQWCNRGVTRSSPNNWTGRRRAITPAQVEGRADCCVYSDQNPIAFQQRGENLVALVASWRAFRGAVEMPLWLPKKPQNVNEKSRRKSLTHNGLKCRGDRT
jgi:hypothetical protein